jgi:hypothetical protein
MHGEGADAVYAQLGAGQSHTLADDVEYLVLTGNNVPSPAVLERANLSDSSKIADSLVELRPVDDTVAGSSGGAGGLPGWAWLAAAVVTTGLIVSTSRRTRRRELEEI